MAFQNEQLLVAHLRPSSTLKDLQVSNESGQTPGMTFHYTDGFIMGSLK